MKPFVFAIALSLGGAFWLASRAEAQVIVNTIPYAPGGGVGNGYGTTVPYWSAAYTPTANYPPGYSPYYTTGVPSYYYPTYRAYSVNPSDGVVYQRAGILGRRWR